MTTAEVARRYFQALSAHDLDTAIECWHPGGIDRFVGQQELVAPDGVREYFATLFEAFPDFRFEIVHTTSSRNRTAVRWRAQATFAGPGRFQGFVPNGARIETEGCDVLTVSDGKIERNEAFTDSAAVARQLGFLPPIGSPGEARLTALANLRTRILAWIHGDQPEPVATGVWIVRGGFPLRTMNVYLLADEGGVTVFDAGISAMPAAVRAAGARLGGIRRVVLGHADAEHRGAAGALGAPVYCHPADRAAAQSADSFREYWDLSKLSPPARAVYPRLLHFWDRGALQIAGTVEEGEQVAGFRVVHLPGHAPGLIGLYRDSDRLALVSDCFYMLDPQTGIKGGPRVPHAAFNADTEQARDSIRKLAALAPSVAWAGHADPVTGQVSAELERAAAG